MGSGLERAYSKNISFYYYYLLQYNKTEILENIGPFTGWNQDLTTFQNFKISVKGETPGGIWKLPRTLSNSSFYSFLLHLIKNRNHYRIKYAQNHFKSTFGSAYLNSKKTKLKLAKHVKKEPRKASFPWDIGLLFVQPTKMHWYFRILNFITEKRNLMHASYKFSLKFHAKRTISLKLDLECLWNLLRERSRLWALRR